MGRRKGGPQWVWVLRFRGRQYTQSHRWVCPKHREGMGGRAETWALGPLPLRPGGVWQVR